MRAVAIVIVLASVSAMRPHPNTFGIGFRTLTAVRRRIGQALGAWAFGTPRISDTPIAPHVTR
jgi:hypothetical protein